MNPPGMQHQMNGFHQQNTPSSSSNPYPEFSHGSQSIYNGPMSIQQSQRQQTPQHQHQHQQQTIPQHLHAINQSQWTHEVRQNNLQHMPLQPPPQNQPFNHSVWNNVNSMHNPPFPNTMSGMGAFNMPFIPQQVIQDAFAMSAPVEPSDEKVLLQALVESRSRRETYKDALNALHGKNGHSASLWKDYYLDHKDRLDETISVYLNPPKIVLQTIKKPSPSTYKTDTSPVLPPRPLPKRRTETPVEHRPPLPSAGRRSTINSLTAPAPVFGDRLPAPNADIRIPDPPSRSPTPPTVVVPHRGRGNKYTPQDRDFFLKFIAWRLKHDPSLTRNDLCALLAEKAPHHTSQSWASYWSNKHDLPDKILAAAKGDDYQSNGESESEEEKITPRRRPKYRDSSSEEDDEENDADDAEEESNYDDEDEDEPVKVLPESDMGPKGGPFTDADLYVTAKYMVSFPGFDTVSGKEKWQPYSERFPQRSAKSWAEYFRRNEKQLRNLARKIKKQENGKQAELSSIQFQRARPSWASADSKDQHQSKRKHSIDEDADGEDDDEVPPSRSKRGRAETGEA